MDDIQSIQSEQYSFPYHYLPSLSNDGREFTESRSWGFSLSYVTALHHVSSAITAAGSKSHLDIGCGDGALIHLLRQRHPDIRLAGIDYDERAITWARMFSPNETFYCGDLLKADLDRDWNTASLVEVIEHIPPEMLPRFIQGVREFLPSGSKLIITVPHSNKPVSDKHYQHFTFAGITEVMGDQFEVETMFGFEFFPVWEIAYRRLFTGSKLTIESSLLNRRRLAYQIGRKDSDERKCGRIFAIFRAK